MEEDTSQEINLSNLDARYVIIGAGLVILLVAFVLFGLTGTRTLIGLTALFFLPLYFILDNFKLETDEKIFFSFFIGLGMFAMAVYYVNRIIPSLKLTIAITAVVLIGIGLLIKKFTNRKPKTCSL